MGFLTNWKYRRLGGWLLLFVAFGLFVFFRLVLAMMFFPALVICVALAGLALLAVGVRTAAPPRASVQVGAGVEKVREETPSDIIHAKRVLIVENHEAAAEAIKEVLEAAGYECRVLLSPIRAPEIIRIFHPHLLTTGLKMPGLDGFGLIQLIKDEWREALPIVVISSQRGKSYINKAFSLGVDDYLFTPFEPRDLLERLEWVLEKKETHRRETGA